MKKDTTGIRADAARLKNKILLALSVLSTIGTGNAQAENQNSGESKDNKPDKTEFVINQAPSLDEFIQQAKKDSTISNIQINDSCTFITDWNKIELENITFDTTNTKGFSPDDFNGITNPDFIEVMAKKAKTATSGPHQCMAAVNKVLRGNQILRTDNKKNDETILRNLDPIEIGQDLVELVKKNGLPKFVVIQMENPKDLPNGISFIRVLFPSLAHPDGHGEIDESTINNLDEYHCYAYYGLGKSKVVAHEPYSKDTPPQYIIAKETFIQALENQAKNNNKTLIPILEGSTVCFYTPETIPEDLKQNLIQSIYYNRNNTIHIAQMLAEKESNDVDNPQNNAIAKNDVAKKTQKILLPNPTGNNHKKKIGQNAKLKQPAGRPGRPKYIIPLMKDSLMKDRM